MLKLDAKNPECLFKSLEHEGVDKKDIESLIMEIKKGNAKLLSSEHADGVIEVLKDENSKIELFVLAWGGKDLIGYLNQLILFVKNNRVNFLRIQTKSKAVFNIITNRYGFKPCGFINETFIMRRAF